MVTGPKVQELLGKVLKAASSGTVIMPVSQQEYRSKCAQATSKGKGRGKGRGPSTGGQVPPQEPSPMEISMNEAPAL